LAQEACFVDKVPFSLRQLATSVCFISRLLSKLCDGPRYLTIIDIASIEFSEDGHLIVDLGVDASFNDIVD
jgi:hypothetical protein